MCAMVSPVSSDLISTCPSSNHSILCAFLAFRPVGEASRFPGASAKTTTKLSEGTGTLLFGTSRLGHRVRGSGGWDGGGCCPKNVTWVLHSGSARPGWARQGKVDVAFGGGPFDAAAAAAAVVSFDSRNIWRHPPHSPLPNSDIISS